MVQDGKTTAYTYDALGQLIRVDDEQENATWVYEYDQGGNILSKCKYAYGVTTGEPLESKVFTYGNPNWRDQLTAVDGVPITYDQIGNPLNDGEWTYTWENGRQLARMQSIDTDASFVYNENGLRVQKTVNGVVTDYTLHGKNIVHMTQSSNELHFFYDASNKPSVVVFNGVPYSYVKNLQGDVVALLDSTGAVVVRYVYDAWGRPIAKAGTLASTLGTVQPFRYRGYVYDEETGFYYLNSRYYNSACSRFVNADIYICASKGMFTYCSNSPTNAVDLSGKDAIWINASKWLPIVGHTSLLIEYDGTWYYTYFGMSDVIMEAVPDEYLVSLDAFNEFVRTVHPEADPDTAVYDSATYIFGDFSAAYHQFVKEKNAFEKGDNSYNLIWNNCTTKSWELLQLGVAPDGISHAEYMETFCQQFSEYSSSGSIIPNTNDATIRAMFPGRGFTKKEARKNIRSAIYNYSLGLWQFFYVEHYDTLMGE